MNGWVCRFTPEITEISFKEAKFVIAITDVGVQDHTSFLYSSVKKEEVYMGYTPIRNTYVVCTSSQRASTN